MQTKIVKIEDRIQAQCNLIMDLFSGFSGRINLDSSLLPLRNISVEGKNIFINKIWDVERLCTLQLDAEDISRSIVFNAGYEGNYGTSEFKKTLIDFSSFVPWYMITDWYRIIGMSSDNPEQSEKIKEIIKNVAILLKLIEKDNSLLRKLFSFFFR
jgi:hypothetical protein